MPMPAGVLVGSFQVSSCPAATCVESATTWKKAQLQGLTSLVQVSWNLCSTSRISGCNGWAGKEHWSGISTTGLPIGQKVGPTGGGA